MSKSNATKEERRRIYQKYLAPDFWQGDWEDRQEKKKERIHQLMVAGARSSVRDSGAVKTMWKEGLDE